MFVIYWKNIDQVVKCGGGFFGLSIFSGPPSLTKPIIRKFYKCFSYQTIIVIMTRGSKNRLQILHTQLKILIIWIEK